MVRKTTLIRKKEIVDVAWELIARKGASNLTIRNIAQKLRVSEPAIYRHYKNKHFILMALIDNFESRLFEAIDYPIKEIDNPLLKLKEIMKAHMILDEKKQGMLFAVTAESIHFNDDRLRRRILSVIDQYKQRIKIILSAAKKKGLVRKDINLDAASLTFFGLIQTAIIQYALTNYTVPPITKFHILWEVFLNGIYEAQPKI